MTIGIIVFPPLSGGNHLRNLISLSPEFGNSNINDSVYQSNNTVHVFTPQGSNNLEKIHFNNTSNNILLHGHFGEIMRHQSAIRQLACKKFISICVETDEDRQLLSMRYKFNQYSPFSNQNYFSGEQIFLYDYSMYHYYFDVPTTDIMNIPITEWFVKDITPVLLKINYFLQTSIDIDRAIELHEIWYNNNLI